MKILFLVDGHVLRMGGAELQAFSLAQRLQAQGHTVEIVAPHLDRNTEKNTEHRGMKVRQLGYWRIAKLSSVFFMLRFAWFLRKEGRNFDAIHIHMVHKMAAVTGLLRPYAPCPVIAKVSGAYEFFDGEQSSIMRFGSLQYWLYKAVSKLDHFQAISKDTCQRLEQAGIDAEKIHAIPNGVDTDKFIRSKALHSDKEQHKTVISYCGRLVAVKGLHTLIAAAAKLQQQFPERFEIQLNGDGPLGETLRQQVSNLGLESVVLFNGRNDSVTDALQSAHVYVQVSRYEGLSNAVLEAMSSGLPLVLSAVGGNKDVVQQGRNGYLVESGDVDALADALARLINDRPLCQKLGDYSRQWAESQFSLNAVSQDLLKLYGENPISPQLETVRSS